MPSGKCNLCIFLKEYMASSNLSEEHRISTQELKRAHIEFTNFERETYDKQ
jgi:hypothetical protein